MKKIMPRICLSLVALSLSFGVQAEFNDDLISHLRSLDNKILTRGKTLTDKKIADIWQRMDDDVLKALNSLDPKLRQKAKLASLNQAFHWKKIINTLHKGEEVDQIELGAVQVQFYTLAGKTILAEYYHGVGITPTSTFRTFQFNNLEKNYSLKDKMEDLLPERDDLENLQRMALQIQFIPKGVESIVTRFSSLHQEPPRGKRSNRSQIVWEYQNSHLKPIFWFPQVDWHMVDGELVESRGPGEAF
jgi:hypothetical protein